MVSRFHKLLEFIGKLQKTFETHRTVLTVGGTLLSASAAWAGYLARTHHQASIEKRLEAIQSQIKNPQKSRRTRNSILDQYEWIWKYAIPSSTVTLAFGYFLGWRKGRLKLWERMNRDPAISKILKEREEARQKQQAERFRRPLIILSRARNLWNRARTKTSAFTGFLSPSNQLQHISSSQVGKTSEGPSPISLVNRVGRKP
ncbi:hypothetical protein GpartN1_g4506.t1 [Galdieria partita]|uniref:Uncharacterized protein n=1 Tax=Galdieria partita TaxID=83374 RepID=A0A9C7URK7_9RHOD|nr:hypothetical protein GpartN1_g4506.t1 [Galdieria partita]